MAAPGYASSSQWSPSSSTWSGSFNAPTPLAAQPPQPPASSALVPRGQRQQDEDVVAKAVESQRAKAAEQEERETALRAARLEGAAMGQREAARAAASVAKARAELEARTERETQVIASLHSQIQREVANVKKNMDTEMAAARKRLGILVFEVDTLTARRHELAAVNTAMEATRAKAVAELEELLTERNEMRTEVETLQDHHTTLLDHVEDLEDAQKILADDCAALREELRELTQDGTFTSAQVAQQYAEDVALLAGQKNKLIETNAGLRFQNIVQRRLLQRQREKVRERDQALGEATTELQDTKLALAAAEDKVRDLKRALMHRATADAERAQEAADRQELEQEEEAAATAAAQQAEDSTPTRVRVLSVDQRFRKGMTALRAVGGFFGSRRRLAVRRAAADATEAREGGATSSAADRAAGALAEAAAHDKKQRQARRQAESDATAGAATGAGGALSQGGVAAAASPARNDAVSRLRQVVRTVSASQMLYSAQKKKNNATVVQNSPLLVLGMRRQPRSAAATPSTPAPVPLQTPAEDSPAKGSSTAGDASTAAKRAGERRESDADVGTATQPGGGGADVPRAPDTPASSAAASSTGSSATRGGRSGRGGMTRAGSSARRGRRRKQRRGPV